MAENVEYDGYKFAVTFLVAITSIIYTIITYLQNTAVDENFFAMICSFISAGIISAVGFLVYILIKAFTKEVENHYLIENLNQIARQIYRLNIIFFTLLINYILAVVITIFIAPSGPNFIIVPISVIVFLPLAYVMYLTGNLKIKIVRSKNNSIFCVIVIVWIILILIMFFASPMKGQVIVEMKDINYKNDTEIPVTIRVTGLDSGIKLGLFKEESGNLYEVENISLRPTLTDSYNKEKVIHTDYFIANIQDSGKYKVFINSTNMTAGYYELWSLRQGYVQTLGKQGFYLVNKSSIMD